jgi:hypothetical protein
LGAFLSLTVYTCHIRATPSKPAPALGNWLWRGRTPSTKNLGRSLGKGHLFLGYSYRGAELQGYRVTLAWTDCHFGGSRVWFRCPRCDRRAAKLFLDEGHFACRSCHRLAYLSQSDDQFGAFHRRIRKIKQKLGVRMIAPASQSACTSRRSSGCGRSWSIRSRSSIQVVSPTMLKFLKRLR